MPSKKIIKRRIVSVSSTRQIMKAMDMVAASKLQKMKMRLVAARPLFEETNRIIDAFKNCEDTAENVFVKPREVKSTAYVVISSNRGLCGSYNISISLKALTHMNERKNEHVLAIGAKGSDFLRRRGKNILQLYKGMSENALYTDAEDIGKELIRLYESGKVDEVYVAYTHFDSVMTYTPCVIKVLPIGNGPPVSQSGGDMHYEPDAEAFLNHAVPSYLSSFIYGAMLESSSCEQASRMISMNAATKNASEIIDNLTLMYNRKRQADITQEINEIVSGASVSTSI